MIGFQRYKSSEIHRKEFRFRFNDEQIGDKLFRNESEAKREKNRIPAFFIKPYIKRIEYNNESSKNR